jgi:DNA-binding IscR family transcriptional regulator
VIRVLEGPLAIVSCMADHGDCAQASHCTLRNPARKLQAAITDRLDTTTLAELTGETCRRRSDREDTTDSWR